MKFVNPIGRTPGSGVQPRACMCTDGYAGYRGNDDGCVHWLWLWWRRRVSYR